MPPKSEGKARAVEVSFPDGAILRIADCHALVDGDRVHVWSDAALKATSPPPYPGTRAMNVPASSAFIYWE